MELLISVAMIVCLCCVLICAQLLTLTIKAHGQQTGALPKAKREENLIPCGVYKVAEHKEETIGGA